MKWPGRTIWDTRIQGVTGVLCARALHGVEIYTSATFAQATAAPPRVVINPNRMYAIEKTIQTGGFFSINVMPSDQWQLVARLMRMRRREPHKARILGIEIQEDERQIPYLAAALRVVFCEVERQIESGDRRLYVARVLESQVNPACVGKRPLLFSEIRQSSNRVDYWLRWLASVIGLKDLLKWGAARVSPRPPADIQSTTYEMAGSTEEEITRIESYGLSDHSRKLAGPGLAADVHRPVGVCVVGTHWGFEHCRWIRQAHPAARLFVCGRDQQRTAKVAKAMQAEDYFIGVEDAIADRRVEALSLALPHAAHRSSVELAVAAGKHTLVEKPIATTLEDADAMIAAAFRAETTLMVAENMHFRPAVHEAVSRIDAGDIGEPLYLLVHAGGIMRPAGWKRDKQKMGGGVLIDIGVHYVRAMRLIMGEPDRVFASRAMQTNTKLQGEDSMQLLFSSQTGWEAHMLLSWASNRGTLPDIVVAGDAGTLVLWPQKRYIEHFAVEPTLVTRMTGYVRPYWLQDKLRRPEWQRRRIRLKERSVSGYVGEMREFLSCVAEGRAPATRPEDARRDLEIVLACYDSLEQGRQVDIAAWS